MRIVLILYLWVVISACGGEYHHSKIKLATRGDIAAELVKGGSYIVAILEGENYSDASEFDEIVAFIRQHDEVNNVAILGKTGDDNIKRYLRVDFKSNEVAAIRLGEWKNIGIISSAEPNNINYFFYESPDSSDKANLNYAGKPFWLSLIQREPTNKIFPVTPHEDKWPVIAVIDSGVDYEHMGLQGKIWENPGIDAGCNGSLHGCNILSEYAPYGNGAVYPIGTNGPGESCYNVESVDKNTCSHGTKVAGIIAANKILKYKSGGVCPYCKILPIRVLNYQFQRGPGILDSSFIGSLNYIHRLIKNGVPIRVVNASFGKMVKADSVARMIKMIADTKGVVFVAAAGNENTMAKSYPAALPEVISVANICAHDKRKHRTSQFGSWIDIAAPGAIDCDYNLGLFSLTPGDDHKAGIGTSIASPVVAGVAGLLLARYPELQSAAAIRERIISTADRSLYDVPANQQFMKKIDGKDIPLLGAGIVNAKNALAARQTSHPIAERDERVKSGCGAIRSISSRNNSFMVFILMMLLPPIMVSFNQRRMNIIKIFFKKAKLQ